MSVKKESAFWLVLGFVLAILAAVQIHIATHGYAATP